MGELEGDIRARREGGGGAWPQYTPHSPWPEASGLPSLQTLWRWPPPRPDGQ